MNGLTVRELIEELKKEDQDAIVAIENNGYPQTVAKMSTVGWLAGTYYMQKKARIQKEYIMEDEIPDGTNADYEKVLVLGSIITTDEADKSGC